jgi:hypothetical protein
VVAAKVGGGAVVLALLGPCRGQAADALAHAMRLQSIWGGAAVALGSRCWRPRSNWEEGQHVAWLALIRVGGVLGVVHWQGNQQHVGGIGNGNLGLGLLACRRGRDPTINMRWKVEGGRGEGGDNCHGVGGGEVIIYLN